MSLFSPSAWFLWLLRIAGIVLLVIGACPSYDSEFHGSTQSVRWCVGLDASLFLRYECSTRKDVDAAGSDSVTSSWSYDLDLLSWSMAAFVGAVVLLALARALRREGESRSRPESAGAS